MPNTHVNVEKGLGVFSVSYMNQNETKLTPKNAKKRQKLLL